MQHVGDDQLSQQTADLCDPTMSSLLGMDLDNGHNDLDLDLSLKNQFIPMYEDDLYPLLSGDLLWGNDRSPSPKPAVVNNNSWWVVYARGTVFYLCLTMRVCLHRHLPTTENVQDNNCSKDVPSSPSLAKLLKTETTDAAAAASRQQHFDSGGGSLLDGGRDSWGSISKMLHQRYNSGSSAEATGEEPVHIDP